MEGVEPTQPQRDEQEHTLSNQETHQSQGKAMRQFTAVNNYLFTPPEHTVDSFSQQTDNEQTTEPTRWQTTLPPIQSHTPPASPETNALPSIADATGFSSPDIILFPPPQQSGRAGSPTPLFHNDEVRETPVKIVESNVRNAPVQQAQSTDPDVFPRILGVRNADQALEYWESRVRELKNLNHARSTLPSPRASTYRNRDPLSQEQLHRVSKPTGSNKARSAPKAATKPKVTAAASAERSPAPRKRTPKARTYHDFVDSAFPSAQQSNKHKRAPPSKKVEGDNVSWMELSDFAPPISTLDSNSKPLKATWHGSPTDLSTDPDRSHLHQQEVGVAETLRLTGAQYMSNKRKIFQARVQAIKDGKNFTKTAAQGACPIDVNKASQLWEAFEKVGWFKESWFEQYL